MQIGTILKRQFKQHYLNLYFGFYLTIDEGDTKYYSHQKGFELNTYTDSEGITFYEFLDPQNLPIYYGPINYLIFAQMLFEHLKISIGHDN